MVKRFLKDTMRFETPRECLEFQLNGTRACMYKFDKYGVCSTYILGDADTITVPSNEMLKIALEHFEKYGEVEFDAFLDNDRSDIVTIGCWDENATYSKTVINRQIAMLEEDKEIYKEMVNEGEMTELEAEDLLKKIDNDLKLLNEMKEKKDSE